MLEGNDGSPLSLIRKKEQELAQQIQAARREAEAMISQARQRAGSMIEAAERMGLQEAEEHYRQEIAKIERVASRAMTTGKEEAALLLKAGPQKMAGAVKAIIEFILPK